VYRAIHGLCWGLTWSTTRSPGCGQLFYRHLRAPSVCAQLQPPVNGTCACRTYFRNLLSVDSYFCAEKSPTAISPIYFGPLRKFRRRGSEHCTFALRLVSGAPFLQLDVLEFGDDHSDHDAVHLLRYPCCSCEKKDRRAAKFCRIPLRERGTCDVVRG